MPELNPVENVWQSLRAHGPSNRVVETRGDIVDGACEAWNTLIADPDASLSIGLRKWLCVADSRLLASGPTVN